MITQNNPHRIKFYFKIVLRAMVISFFVLISGLQVNYPPVITLTTPAANGTFTTTDTGLVAWYRFDGPSTGSGQAESVKDSSGGAHHGTLHGTNGLPIWNNNSGVSGGALNFDGIDDYVQIPGSDDLNPGPEGLSIDAWVKPIAPPSLGDINVWLHRGPDGATNCNSVNMYFGTIGVDSSTNAPAFQGVNCPNALPPSSGDISSSGRTTATLTTGAWSHVVVVFKLSEHPNRLTFYINGEKQAISDQLAGDLTALQFATNADLFIGSVFGQWGFFNGAIDELAIYNRVITEDEVRRDCRRISNVSSRAERGDLPVWLIKYPVILF